MPSVSPSQARLMAAAAHTKGGFGGVSQSVGRDFNQADKGGSMLKQAMANRMHGAKMQKSMKPMHKGLSPSQQMMDDRLDRQEAKGK